MTNTSEFKDMIIKMRLATLFVLVFMAVPLLVSADIVYEFGDSNAGALPLGLPSTDGIRAGAGDATGYTFFQNGDQTTTSLFFNDFALTDPTTGVSFTFDFTVAPGSAGVTDISATAGVANGSLNKAAGALFAGGDIITITVNDVQVVTPGATAGFLGFVDIGTDNSGGGEGFIIDGTTYTRGGTATSSTYGNENDPRDGIHGGLVDTQVAGGEAIPFFQTGTTTTVEFIGASVSLRAVALGFETTSVPEPSSTLLICALGTISMVRRRR